MVRTAANKQTTPNTNWEKRDGKRMAEDGIRCNNEGKRRGQVSDQQNLFFGEVEGRNEKLEDTGMSGTGQRRACCL